LYLSHRQTSHVFFKTRYRQSFTESIKEVVVVLEEVIYGIPTGEC